MHDGNKVNISQHVPKINEQKSYLWSFCRRTFKARVFSAAVDFFKGNKKNDLVDMKLLEVPRGISRSLKDS